MDENTFIKIYFWIVTGLITIISFFIRVWINERKESEREIRKAMDDMEDDILSNKKEITDRTDSMFTKAIDKFTDVAERLERTVSGLEKIVEVVKEQNIEFTRKFERKERWLEEHDKQLNEHTLKIDRIETKCSMNHGKKG